jgi:hypothetical protein
MHGEMIETAKKMSASYLESQVSLFSRSAMAPLDLNGKLTAFAEGDPVDRVCADTPIKQLSKGPSPVTLDSKPVPQKVVITPTAPTLRSTYSI